MSSICRLNPKRAPGPDRIGAVALKNLPAAAVDCDLEMFNTILWLQYFPRLWKQANIVMLPKPRKPRMLPESYRPTSLLSVIYKVMERLLLAQLWPLLDEFIRSEKFGFRREHSTTLQLVRVVTQLYVAAKKNFSSGAELLDENKLLAEEIAQLR